MKNTFKFNLKNVVIDVPDTKGLHVESLDVEITCDMAPEEYTAGLTCLTNVVGVITKSMGK